jgi:ferric-dicitrate binding protein FerR (iron transport regulator)
VDWQKRAEQAERRVATLNGSLAMARRTAVEWKDGYDAQKQQALENFERIEEAQQLHRQAEARVKELEKEVEAVRYYSRLQEDAAAARLRRIENMEEVEAELRASLATFQAGKKVGNNA